jgi:hypothetical protein
MTFFPWDLCLGCYAEIRFLGVIGTYGLSLRDLSPMGTIVDIYSLTLIKLDLWRGFRQLLGTPVTVSASFASSGESYQWGCVSASRALQPRLGRTW